MPAVRPKWVNNWYFITTLRIISTQEPIESLPLFNLIGYSTRKRDFEFFLGFYWYISSLKFQTVVIPTGEGFLEKGLVVAGHFAVNQKKHWIDCF